MSAPRLLVIQHDHVSPLGPIARAFEEHGWEIDYHLVVPGESFFDPGVESDFPQLDGYAAVLPMGAAWSVYDTELIGSWVLPEIDLLREADRRGIPTFGICFGGQMLAAAHGGQVTHSPSPELGWVDIDATDGIPGGPWFQWHSDRWSLPPGATELARNDAASQAFVIGRNLGVQFHPELNREMLLGWLGNGGDAWIAEKGIDRNRLVEETANQEAGSALRAAELVEFFLSHAFPDRNHKEQA